MSRQWRQHVQYQRVLVFNFEIGLKRLLSLTTNGVHEIPPGLAGKEASRLSRATIFVLLICFGWGHSQLQLQLFRYGSRRRSGKEALAELL